MSIHARGPAHSRPARCADVQVDGASSAKYPALETGAISQQAAVIGREREIAAVSAFLDSVPHGPGALLIEGEAGIGKSTVWFESIRLAEARGYQVLRARPAESEAKLSYAALADIIGPAFDEARARLPHPQELALSATLLRVTSSEPADPRTVATAVVGVLTELVRDQPVLVAIDDVQWVDLASRRALEFAVRRLPAQLRLLVTRRGEGAAEVPLELDRALPPDAFQRVVLGIALARVVASHRARTPRHFADAPHDRADRGGLGR